MRHIVRLGIACVMLTSFGVAVLAAGCESFDASDPAAAADAAPDGALESSAAPNADASSSVDGSAPDSGADAEAEADAEADAGAVDAGFVCPPGAFCDDFERDVLIGSWSGVTSADPDGGYPDASFLQLDTTHARSGTRSLRVRPAFISRASLLKFVDGKRRVEVRFALRAEAAANEAAHIITVDFGGDSRSFLQLLLLEGGLAFNEGFRTPPDGAPEVNRIENAMLAPIGAFGDYVFVVDLDARKLTLTQGGDVREFTIQETHDPTKAVLAIGAYFATGDLPPHWMDDVVVLTGP